MHFAGMFVVWFYLFLTQFLFLCLFLSQAYGSGCDVVILASNFDCVQIIPGAQNGNIQVGCVECSHQLGRVSVDCTLRRTPTRSFHFSVQPWRHYQLRWAKRSPFSPAFAPVLYCPCSPLLLLSCSLAPLPSFPSPVGTAVQKHWWGE